MGDALRDTGLPSALLAPAGLWCEGEDSIRLTVLNAAAGVTVRLTYRFLHVDGKLEVAVERLVPATDRTASTVTRPLGRGWLLSAQAIVSVGAPLSGQCFATLSLVRGRTGAFDDYAALAAAYLTAAQRVAFPGSLIWNSLDGGGALRSITGTVPGAGADWSETVPTGARWQLLALRASLTTAVAAASRVVEIQFDDGALTYFRSSAQANQAASLTHAYNCAQSINFQGAGGANGHWIPAPANNRLGAAHRIRSSTIALQAADQWTAPQYLIREWVEGA